MTEQYQLLPDLTEDEYAALKADIAARGVMVPVEVDEHGNVLDGHHRVRACEELGIEEWPSIIRPGMTEGEKHKHVLALNLERRHLNQKQKRELIERVLTMWPELSNRQIGDLVGADHVTVGTARDELVATGEIHQLDRTVGADGKERPAKRAAVHAMNAKDTQRALDAMRDTPDLPAEDMTVAQARQAAARAHPPEPAKTQPLPEGKFRCIVADPPWPMQKIEREERADQGDALDYPTMTIEGITALPVADLADEAGCHLYLWTTHKFLPDALDIAAAWGFRYQCLMTWVKPTGMTPYSWMYDTEHVVFARRGNLQLTQLGLKLSFAAPTTRHSAKPDVFYERVVQASPGPRVELFARTPRDGFAVWGNEV